MHQIKAVERTCRQMHSGMCSKGKAAFRLYETFGLPLDFMVDAARDAGIAFDTAGLRAAKEEEQARARASLEGWVAEVGGAGLSGVGEDGV